MFKTNLVTFDMFFLNLSEKALDLICILQTLRDSPLIFFVLKEQSIVGSMQNVFTILFSFDCICTVILTYEATYSV